MKNLKLILIALLLSTSIVYSKDYSKKKEVKSFINTMVKKHKFNRNELNKLFKKAQYKRSALAVYDKSKRIKKKYKPSKKPKKKVKYIKRGSWDIYQNQFVNERKIRLGVKYMKKHQKDLKRAYKKYNVEPEYITAIIGVESDYGNYRGKYRVFDALTTLSFEKNRRNKFFKNELKEFLLLSRNEGFDPLAVKGSFAGAIGLGQFMPSNYRSYVVDFNKDGKKQMNNHTDAIGSVAYYFKRHNWKKNIPIATRVKYKGNRYNSKKTGYKNKYSRISLKGITPKDKFAYNKKVHLIKLKRANYDELWYGSSNFYTITRYNHSSYYAMAVHQLATAIKKAYDKK